MACFGAHDQDGGDAERGDDEQERGEDRTPPAPGRGRGGGGCRHGDAGARRPLGRPEARGVGRGERSVMSGSMGRGTAVRVPCSASRARPPLVAVLGFARHGLITTSSSAHGDRRPDLAGAGRARCAGGPARWRRRVGEERRRAAQRLVEHDAEGVDVGAGVDRLALDLLGGEVLGGAEHGPGRGEVGRRRGLGDAEVGDQHPPVVAQRGCWPA